MSRSLRTLGFLLAAALLGSLFGTAITIVAGPAPAESATTVDTITTGCVIRFDDASWNRTRVYPRIHANSTHINTGCTGVTVTAAGDLRIGQTQSQPIVSLSVDPDETLARKGIVLGGSGGSGHTTVVMYDRAGRHLRADSMSLYGSTTNLWVMWTHMAP